MVGVNFVEIHWFVTLGRMFYIWIAGANTQHPLLFSQVNISRRKEGPDLEEELRPEHMVAVTSAT